MFAAEVKRYASQGVDAGAMPAGNSSNGERQLHARIKQELPVLAADRKLRDAKKALELLQGSLLVVPGWRSFNIPWPAVAGNHAQAIAAIGNLAAPRPTHPDIMGYLGVAEELGYAGTILPEKYQQVFNQLVELVGGRSVARRVEYTIQETSDSNQALSLLAKLPETRAIAEMRTRLKAIDKKTPTTTKRRTKLQLT